MAIEDYIDGHNKIPSPSSGSPRLKTSWRKTPAQALLLIKDDLGEVVH
jgi:hypothetical protein